MDISPINVIIVAKASTCVDNYFFPFSLHNCVGWGRGLFGSLSVSWHEFLDAWFALTSVDIHIGFDTSKTKIVSTNHASSNCPLV